MVRQTGVKNQLNGLRLSQLINSETDTTVALEKVYKRIINMSHQVPVNHCGDDHKIEFLLAGVMGHK